jgi:O-antigen/teichoic acid export membrane protein
MAGETTLHAEAAPAATAAGTNIDESRLPGAVKSLRAHTARGTVVNSGFQVGLAGLGMLQRIAVAGFLTRAEFGIYGIVLTILVTLAWLKQIGIVDKYIQQSEPDQELAFQKAFTLELGLSLAYFLLVVLVVPLYALAYGRTDIVIPCIILALTVPLSAFESPAWIPYRRMQYARQRTLTAADSVVAFVVTIVLGAMGFGYWCLVFGVLAGSLAGGLLCTVTSPYKIRIRYDRRTLRDYASFSWPLLGGGMSRLVVVQGTLIIATRTAGVSAVGSIGLAVGVALFSDRVDTIVSTTLYPAVCAVAHRTELLYEVFLKSNRIALMWAAPFSACAVLFAHDLTQFILGQRWNSTAPLIAAIALCSGVGQVAFNWSLFMRALNRTRPLFIAAIVNLTTFAAVMVPALIEFGLAGYAIGMASATLAQLAVRGYFLRGLFPGFRVLAQLWRAAAPTLPAVAAVLLVRLLIPDGRSLSRALAELALFCMVAVGSTYLLERQLVRELISYLHRRRARGVVPAMAGRGG